MRKRLFAWIMAGLLLLTLARCLKPSATQTSNANTAAPAGKEDTNPQISNDAGIHESETPAPSQTSEDVGWDTVTLRDENGNILLNNSCIASVDYDTLIHEQYAIYFNLTDEGARIFANATVSMIGETVYLYFDDTLITRSQISAPIVDNQFLLGGAFFHDDADYLLRNITARLDQSQSVQATAPPDSTPQQPNGSASNADVDAFYAKLKDYDFSDIAGIYDSVKFGSAKINQYGEIWFDNYYIGTNPTPQTNVFLDHRGSRGEGLEIIRAENENYIFWHIMNDTHYDTQLNGKIMIEDWITIFPAGVPTVGRHYEGPEINCPDVDTSEHRFVIFFLDFEITDDEVFIRRSE